MRAKAIALVGLALAALVITGCWYEQPKLAERFKEIEVGMARDDVVDILGKPSIVIENEMFYLYDDPEKPARFRFVMDEQSMVIEKYFETKEELAARAEETKGEVPPIALVPGEDPRTYPGGPIKRFEKVPGKPGN